MFEKLTHKTKETLKIASIGALAAFLTSCENNRPSVDTLNRLLQENKKVEKVDLKETEEVNRLIRLAKEKGTTILYKAESDSLSVTVEADTADSTIRLLKEHPNKHSNGNNYVNKIYSTKGGFNYRETFAKDALMPHFAGFYADPLTGVITGGLVDVPVDSLAPEYPHSKEGGRKEFKVTKEGNIDGDLDFLKPLHEASVEGVKELEALDIK